MLYKRKFKCKIFAETKELVHTKVLESFIFLKYLEMKYYFRPVSWYLCNISTMWQLYERTVRCECKDTFCNNTHLSIFTTDFKIVLKWPSKDFNIWESTFYLVRKGMCDERICICILWYQFLSAKTDLDFTPCRNIFVDNTFEILYFIIKHHTPAMLYMWSKAQRMRYPSNKLV